MTFKEEKGTYLILLVSTRKDLLTKLEGRKKCELQTTKLTATGYIVEMAKHGLCAFVHVCVERRQSMHIWYYTWFQAPTEESRERNGRQKDGVW